MSKSSQIWRIFSDTIPNEGFSVAVTENEHHYVRSVLRLRVNESAEITDGQGTIAQAVLESCDKNESKFKIVSKVLKPLPNSQMILIVGTPKPSALEELVSITSELGVHEIHLVKSDLSQNKQDIRVDRLSKIAREALRISKSPWEPKIIFHASVHATKNTVNQTAKFLCDESPIYEGKGRILNHLAAALTESSTRGRVAIYIGPESSFSQNEREVLTKDIGAVPVSLGENILRTPTAAVSATAITLAYFSSIK